MTPWSKTARVAVGAVSLELPAILQRRGDAAIDSAASVFEGGGLLVTVDHSPFASRLDSDVGKPDYKEDVKAVGGVTGRTIFFRSPDDGSYTVGIHVPTVRRSFSGIGGAGTTSSGGSDATTVGRHASDAQAQYSLYPVRRLHGLSNTSRVARLQTGSKAPPRAALFARASRPPAGMRRQHAVVQHQVDAGSRDERRQFLEQLQWLEHELPSGVRPRRPQRQLDPAIVPEPQPVLRHRLRRSHGGARALQGPAEPRISRAWAGRRRSARAGSAT